MPAPNEADRGDDVETGPLLCDEGALRFGSEWSGKVSGHGSAAGRELQEWVFAGKSSRESALTGMIGSRQARLLAKRRKK